MDAGDRSIRGACPLFACRFCRTKRGWPHQRWCAAAGLTEPECPDCRYHDPGKGSCAHPARKVVLGR